MLAITFWQRFAPNLVFAAAAFAFVKWLTKEPFGTDVFVARALTVGGYLAFAALWCGIRQALFVQNTRNVYRLQGQVARGDFNAPLPGRP